MSHATNVGETVRNNEMDKSCRSLKGTGTVRKVTSSKGTNLHIVILRLITWRFKTVAFGYRDFCEWMSELLNYLLVTKGNFLFDNSPFHSQVEIAQEVAISRFYSNRYYVCRAASFRECLLWTTCSSICFCSTPTDSTCDL